MTSKINDFLESEKPRVMMAYKDPESDIEKLLEELPEEEVFVVADMVRNYSIDTLEGIADRTVGEDYFYGVRNMLPNDQDTSRFKMVRNPGDLDNRTEMISDIVVQDIMTQKSDPDTVYVLDDMDNALGFNDDRILFQYAHSMTGRFMSLEADSIILANTGYEGLVENLANTEYDLTT
jgi:hypothetical protein